MNFAGLDIEAGDQPVPGTFHHRYARCHEDTGFAVTDDQSGCAVITNDQTGTPVLTLGPGSQKTLSTVLRRCRHHQCLKGETTGKRELGT